MFTDFVCIYIVVLCTVTAYFVIDTRSIKKLIMMMMMMMMMMMYYVHPSVGLSVSCLLLSQKQKASESQKVDYAT